MKCVELFRKGDHRWLAFGQDPTKPEAVIDTNQVVVTAGGEAMLLDPGGSEIFPPMVAALTARLPIEQVRHILLTHQDPDIGSSIGLWRRVCGDHLQVHASWMWTGFLAHFDGAAAFEPLPDEGKTVRLGERSLHILPAHYLHSPGNYCLYDPAARILFSGDVGAALVPAEKRHSFFVENFAEHVGFMKGFHERWMGSTRARDAWIAMVSRLDVDMMVPQHGLIFRGDDIPRFLDWLGSVEIGSGLAAFEQAVDGIAAKATT